MNNLVLSTIEKYNLLNKGDKVIVALSGGADSVTLLDLLYRIKDSYNLTIYSAHLNHNIRGDEAKRDEDFCKSLCQSYNIELFVKSVDIKSLAQKNKISEELCGRNARYDFFAELSQKLGAKIATAHTASDNIETMLFNIARGSSLRGLGGIAPKRDNIIRPLIECTRTQIENYCTENSLDFVLDSTNLSDDYTRNSIRHKVVPPLKSIVNPSLELATLRFSENAREITQYLDKQTNLALKECEVKYGYDCKKLLSLDVAILKNALVVICKAMADFSPEYRHISLMMDILKNDGAVNLTQGYKAVAKQGIFRITKDKASVLNPIALTNDLVFKYNSKTYTIKETPLQDKTDYISACWLDKNAEFRTRRQGDKFTYKNRKITKPLRKVFNEMKIPSEIRDSLVVLATDSTILWCEGIGTSLEADTDCIDKRLYINISSADN